MPRSHLHVKVRPERATTYHEDNFLEIELDVAHSWQLLGSKWLLRCLRGCWTWLFRGNYCVYVAVALSSWLLRGQCPALFAQVSHYVALTGQI